MKWMNYFAGLTLALAVLAGPARAESYGDPWAGMYGTGGYNLFDFGLDLYGASSYLSSNYGSDNWGGSCGSYYSSCGGSYGLYGSDWGTSPYLYGGGSYGQTGWNVDINISLYSDPSSYMWPSSYGSLYGGMGNSWDLGCSVGYCSSQTSSPWVSPYGGGGSYYGNVFGGSTSYGLPGTFPIDINVNPWTNGSYLPPTQIPPYGGCGLYVPCSTGPITRNDPPIYPPVYPPVYPPTFPQPPIMDRPQYQPQDQFVPNDPVRYRIPRGATH